MKKLASSFVLALVILLGVVVVSETYYTRRAQLYNEAVATVSEATGISDSIIRVSPVGDEIRWELDQSFGKNPVDCVYKAFSNLITGEGR